MFLTDKPVQFLYAKAGNYLGAPTTRSRAPAGATSGNSIVLNRNEYGSTYETLTFLHELLHTTKKGDAHVDIARAIAGMEGIDSQLKAYLKAQDDREDESSGFINSWLNENCDIGNNQVAKWADVLKKIGANR